MKTATKLFLLSLLLGCISVPAFAQNIPGQGTVGISASLQGNQANILFPIWTSEQVVIAPLFGIVYQEDVATRLNLGIKPRFYQTLGEDFASYIGVQGLLQYTSRETGDDQTDFVIGVNGGGEYFFSPHFSLGVEGQLNMLLEDDGNNALATGTAFTGTYYF